MRISEHLAILNQGIDVWNRWRQEHPKVRANFRGADLNGKHLSGIDLRTADLRRADLRKAVLRKANLTRADLSGALLRRTDFSAAALNRTDLTGTDFTWTQLRGTDLSDARIGWTTFADVDLGDVNGLLSVRHSGPSSIGIDTLFRSRGRIPDVFLRRAGVPENLITYSASLVGQPIQFYSCFISYSSEDQEFADRLYADLQSKGVRCWFAPHHIRAGRKVHEQIDDAIRLYDRLLLILSEHSMNSTWVHTEIAHARHKEVIHGRRVLFPISLVPFAQLKPWTCFDADIGKDSAREIREYFIPDFSNWTDHSGYREQFRKLLTSLHAEEGDDVANQAAQC
jgi:uncharacterized protein YjbI with pentapeptide repeats